MSDDIRRFEDEAEYDGDEMLALVQAEKAGRPTPQFERPEYLERKAETLEAGGHHEEAEELRAAATPRELAEMSPDDHLKQIRAGRR